VLARFDYRQFQLQCVKFALSYYFRLHQNRYSKRWKALLQVKNVGSDELEGKVGRIYMPAQDVGSMALHKMKVRTSGLLSTECRQSAFQADAVCACRFARRMQCNGRAS
jgi:hypothetical protein